MKTNFVITILILFSNILLAQHQNLDKLPQKERDSILVKVANEAINRFSIGYLRPGNKPYIEDIGYKLSETYKKQCLKQYADRYLYAVYYLATDEEKKFYKNDTLVKALVLADIGKVTEIIYIDDSEWRALALEKATPQEKFTKRKFKTVEERLKEIEKFNKPKTLYLDPPPEMRERYREFLEMKKRKRDSGIILRQRYLQKQDSIGKQDSIKESRKGFKP